MALFQLCKRFCTWYIMDMPGFSQKYDARISDLRLTSEMLKEVDRICGKRHRSEFIREAIDAAIKRHKRREKKFEQ